MQALTYGVALTQGTLQNLAYLNTGEPATITLLITNPGAPVVLESVAIMVVAGTAGSDLVLTPGDIAFTSFPEGWTPGPGLTLTPPAGTQLGTESIQVVLGLTVSSAYGVATLGVKLQTSAGTSFMNPPASITKMPPGFTLANVIATPPQVPPGGTVALTWTATPGLPYQVSWQAGTYAVTPATSLASWTSPPVATQQPSIGFSISAHTQDGSGLFVQVPGIVQVDNPQITSFPQPLEPFYMTPVQLVWTTINADSCRLMSGGIVLDGNAPANSPLGGYSFNQTAASMSYQLYALKGTAVIPSQPITVDRLSWAQVASVPMASPFIAVAVSNDGSTLYVVDGGTLKTVDTTRNVVLATGPAQTHMPVSATLASNGMLYMQDYMSSVCSYSTASLAQVLNAGDPATAMGVRADGSAFYIHTGGEFLVLDGSNGSPEFQQPLGDFHTPQCGIAMVPRSNNAAFVSFTDVTQQTLFYFDGGGSVRSVGSAAGGAITVSADGRRLYALAPGGAYIVEYALPSLQQLNSFAFLDGPQMKKFVCDPFGAGLYITSLTNDGSGLWFLDPATGVFISIATMSGMNTDVAVSPDGSRIYWSGANQVMAISATIPRLAQGMTSAEPTSA